ncbi:MAG: hypothetical protein R3D29_02490 [Nitratireductor sp.]
MQQLPALIGKVSKDVIVIPRLTLICNATARKFLRETLDGEGGKKNVSRRTGRAGRNSAIRALIAGGIFAKPVQPGDRRKAPNSAPPSSRSSILPRWKSSDAVRSGSSGCASEDRQLDPENYDRSHRGPVTLSDGLTQSLEHDCCTTGHGGWSEDSGRDRAPAWYSVLNCSAMLSIALGTLKCPCWNWSVPMRHFPMAATE